MASLGIPLPPDIAGQMPSMGQYAGGMAGAAPPVQNGDPNAGMEADPALFANESLNAIADMLMKVAQVVQQTRPELMPYIQKMAEAGEQLQAQMTATGDPGAESGGVEAPPKPEGPKDVSMA